MTEDDNGEPVRILKSQSHYPFFSYYIQDREKNYVQEAVSEEEYCIEETYSFFYEQLEEKNIRKHLTKWCGRDAVHSSQYVEILKAIRDQVLQTTFVSISTTDKEQANMIFEILNAKGKRLAEVDLIKNKIFEILNDTEPADFAEELWKRIKGILNSGKDTIGLETFYRHFWSARYKKSSKSKLYDDFNRVITPKNKQVYMAFLVEMERYAKYYMMILNPKREDYDNRKEYFPVVQMLNVLNNYFGIVQVRVVELAMLRLKDDDLIDLKNYKRVLSLLEVFHFVYNSLMKGNPNKIEKIYSAFAIESLSCKNKTAVRELINSKLIEPLRELLPAKEDFIRKFAELEYSKRDCSCNIKTKYALNKINSYFEKCEMFSDDGTIEHIISEAEGRESLNVGNLIILEGTLNIEADNMEYADKIMVYSKSKYVWINKFINENKEWQNSLFSKRANEMAILFYDDIVMKEIKML